MRRRNSLRLPEYAYDSPGAYFVTICSAAKACLFGEISDDQMQPAWIGIVVGACWKRLPERHTGVGIDAFVVMPNHVHGIVLLDDGARQASPLHVVIGSFKACASRTAGKPLWQRGYFERVIRDERELCALRQYIADNPLKWAADIEYVGARPASP